MGYWHVRLVVAKIRVVRGAGELGWYFPAEKGDALFGFPAELNAPTPSLSCGKRVPLGRGTL